MEYKTVNVKVSYKTDIQGKNYLSGKRQTQRKKQNVKGNKYSYSKGKPNLDKANDSQKSSFDKKKDKSDDRGTNNSSSKGHNYRDNLGRIINYNGQSQTNRNNKDVHEKNYPSSKDEINRN